MILEIIALILSVPVGYLIAWLARDELVQGRKWFWVLIITAFVCAVIFYLRGEQYIVLTAAFVAVVSGISLWKSHDAKWTAVKK